MKRMKNFTCIANLHYCVVLLFMWLLPTNGYCQDQTFSVGGKSYIHRTEFERVGVLTSKNDTIVPIKYVKVEPFEKCLKVTNYSGMKGIYDYSGKEVLSLELNLSGIKIIGTSYYLYQTTDEYGRVAVYSSTGAALLPPSFYLDATIFGNTDNNFFIKIQDGPYQGIVDMYGNMIIPPTKYNVISGHLSNNGYYYGCTEYGNGSSCLDYTGKELIHTDALFTQPNIVDGKLMGYLLTDKGFGVGKLDLNGNVISSVEPKEWIKNTTSNHYRIRNIENQMGVLTKNGDTIVPLKYNNVVKIDSIYCTFQRGYTGFYDLNGRCILDADTSTYNIGYDALLYGYLLVQNKFGYNVYKKNGQRIFNEDYPYIKAFTHDDSVFLVRKDIFQKGALFINNQQRSDYLYDNIAFFFPEKDFLGVTQDGKLGFITYDGEPIINCMYDNAQLLYDDNGYKFRVQDGPCYGLYSSNGKLLIPANMYTSLEWDKNSKQYIAKIGKRMYRYDIDGKIKETTETDMKADSLILKADNAFMADKFGEAIRLYNAANKLRPEATSYYNLGASYFNRGNYKKSITCLESCFKYSPSANIKTQAYDLLDRARQLREEQIVARQQMALAFLGAVVAGAAGALSGAIGNSNHTTYASPTTQKSISSQSSSYSSSSSSSSYSSSSESSTSSTPSKVAHKCDRCHGTGTILRTSTVATYGNDKRVVCPVCHQEHWASTVHHHEKCSTCNGTGTVYR